MAIAGKGPTYVQQWTHIPLQLIVNIYIQPMHIPQAVADNQSSAATNLGQAGVHSCQVW